MKTPKEKAEELVIKFMKHSFHQGSLPQCRDHAKQCALIAVEFARDQFQNYCCAEMHTVGSPDDHFDVLKQEIENL